MKSAKKLVIFVFVSLIIIIFCFKYLLDQGKEFIYLFILSLAKLKFIESLFKAILRNQILQFIEEEENKIKSYDMQVDQNNLIEQNDGYSALVKVHSTLGYKLEECARSFDQNTFFVDDLISKTK